MKTLILHPTDISQWHALVYEAQATSNIVLTETTESYLVFLLMRYSNTTQLLESVMALDFLESMHTPGHQRAEQMQLIGDKSLLLCGLFPGLADRRRVTLSYFSDIGQAAYLTASELYERHQAELYYQLSSQFTTLQKILQSMRQPR